MKSIGVVGLGTVGGALHEALEQAGFWACGYDPYLAVGRPDSLTDCSLVFLCVSTPPGASGELDTSAVWKAMRDIGGSLADGTIIAVKSTVPPGTSSALALEFPRFEFASVPEFLVAVRPMESLSQPDRIVVGARSPESFLAVATVMRAIAPSAPILMLAPTEAELMKLSANAMLASKVSIANELALICERFGVEWSNIQAAVGLDRRIGIDHMTVSAERGFSGGCLPKDLDGLVAASTEGGYVPSLLVAVSVFNRAIRHGGNEGEGTLESTG